MSGLRDIQLRFADHLFGQQDWELCSLINASGLSPERRLQIYHNNVFVSLRETLLALYPAVEKLVGEEYFGQAAHRYVEEYPSRSGNILDYGAHFAKFLRSAPGIEELPYVPEIAQLEWRLHRVFHAADAAVLDPASLADVDPDAFPQLKFELHPALFFTTSRFPLLDIWQLATGQSDQEQVDVNSGPDWLLGIRRSLETELVRLSQDEYLLLAALEKGKTLTTSCEEASALVPDFELQPALARLFQLGALTGFSLPSPA